jgi:hypothetical protein
MTLTPHDSIDIIERILKSYRYDYEKEIDNEDEEPSPLTVLMDIKQILHNTLAPKWSKLDEVDEQNKLNGHCTKCFIAKQKGD